MIYIKFYYAIMTRKHLSWKTIYDKELKELTDYHENYGKDGFLSERTYADDREFRAKVRADLEFHNQDINISIEKAIISSDEDIKEIESRPEFDKWV